MTALKPTPEEIAWAAGLFEGEGSISRGRRERGSITLQLTMTDEDVVRRFHEILGVGTVVPRDRGPRRKPVWAWSARTLDAVFVLSLLARHFGARRARRADELLREREAYKAEATKERVCAGCERPFRPEYSKAAPRRIYCSKRCAYNAHNWRRRGAPSRH